MTRNRASPSDRALELPKIHPKTMTWSAAASSGLSWAAFNARLGTDVQSDRFMNTNHPRHGRRTTAKTSSARSKKPRA